MIISIVLVAIGVLGLQVVTPAAATDGGSMAVANNPTGNGYWTATAKGVVSARNGAAFLGDLDGQHLNQAIVGMTATSSGNGYWLVASDGGVFSFGDARFFGSTGSIHLNQPVVGIASTNDSRGYWLVASDGGIFAYGDASFFGSTGGSHLNKPIVGMAATTGGRGYWLVASDGGIFAYGDAHFQGSTGSAHLNQPVVGMAPSATGNGYWLVAADGGIFAYGDAPFLGSNVVNNQSVYGIAKDSANGYYVLSRTGTIIHFINSNTLVNLPPNGNAGGSSGSGGSTGSGGQSVGSINPFVGQSLYVNPGNPATAQATAWASTQPANAATMTRLGNTPTASWFGDWSTNIQSDVSSVVSSANSTNQLPVLVAYNIPQRDCGSYSSGGVTSANAYASWIRNFAAGIGTTGRAVVIVEPDALAGMDCLSSADQAARTTSISDAVNVLSAIPGVAVYLDAGNSNWHTAADTASRLQAAGIAHARGFSLNVSNFQTTASNTAFGDQVAALTNSHYVIDTSRNGNGPSADPSDIFNPMGRALGTAPTTSTGDSSVDAFLWVKQPGESDGAANGGPNAGQWWAAYALGLAQSAGW